MTFFSELSEEMSLGIVQTANVSKAGGPIAVEKWVCIYPAYIDESRTIKQGRRLSQNECTKLPDAFAIFYVCGVLLKLQCCMEQKRYSRSAWDYAGPGVGRVKVRMKDDNGECTFVDPTDPFKRTFTSRKQLFRKVAEILNDPETKIPKNYQPTVSKAEAEALKEQERLEKEAAAAKGGSSNKKKKGKKKKRR